MNDFPILTASLLDLLYELRETPVRLIIGGGFGLYLKRQSVADADVPTLLAVPEARSTQDIDIFLRTEILAYETMLVPFREALGRLGYTVVEGAKHWQFKRLVQLPGGEGHIKIDLLTGPPHQGIPSELVRVDDRRVKSSLRDSRLHGRLTPEAFSLEDHLVEVVLKGQRTTGEHYESIVFLPQTFHSLVMKLFAYRDAEIKSHDPANQSRDREYRRQNAVKHSFDLYAILAETNEPEWEEAKRLYAVYSSESVVQEARTIVQSDFSNRDAPGVLRLRENANFAPEMPLDTFLELLHEAFALPGNVEKTSR